VSWTQFRQYLQEWASQREKVAEYFNDLEIERDAEHIIDDKVDGIFGTVERIKGFLDGSNMPTTRQELLRKDKEELVQLLLKSEYLQALEQRKHQSQPSFIQSQPSFIHSSSPSDLRGLGSSQFLDLKNSNT